MKTLRNSDFVVGKGIHVAADEGTVTNEFRVKGEESMGDGRVSGLYS